MTIQIYSKEAIDQLFAALDQATQRIELLEAVMIETNNGKIFCLACHNHAYAGEKIQHRKDCLLHPGEMTHENDHAIYRVRILDWMRAQRSVDQEQHDTGRNLLGNSRN